MQFFRHVITGLRILARGFGFYLTRPTLMLLGALPALIVGIAYLAAIVLLANGVGPLAEWLTPFAEPWDEAWRSLLRFGIAVLVLAAGVGLGVLMFSAVTLMIGGPIYERIAIAVDREYGQPERLVEPTFWATVRRSIGDGVVLGITAVVLGLAVFLIGLIPVIGSVAAAIGAALVGGRALAIELTGASADARGLTLAQRRKLLAKPRGVSLGFGVACYLLFLIPGGAVIGTPAAIAGAAFLVRELRGEATVKIPSASTS